MMARFRRWSPALAMVCLLWTASAALADSCRTDFTAALVEARESDVPDEIIGKLVSLAYAQRMDLDEMGGLLRRLSQASRAELPLQPFVGKIEEGFSKQIPPDRIDKVLSQKIDDYGFTKSQLDGFARRSGVDEPVDDDDLIRLSETLYCGLTRKDMGQILEAAPPASIPVVTRAVETLASLKQVGFDQQLSREMIVEGIRHSYFTPSQRDFGKVVAAARNRGVSDKDIASAAISGMQSGKTVEGWSAALGISSSDFGRHGPQVGRDQAGRGRSFGGWPGKTADSPRGRPAPSPPGGVPGRTSGPRGDHNPGGSGGHGRDGHRGGDRSGRGDDSGSSRDGDSARDGSPGASLGGGPGGGRGGGGGPGGSAGHGGGGHGGGHGSDGGGHGGGHGGGAGGHGGSGDR